MNAPLSPWKIGLQSVKANLIPGVILQCFAIALIVGYHVSADFRAVLDVVAGWQARFGVVFLCAGYFFFAGLLPSVISWCVPSIRPQKPVLAFLFAILFWSFNGFLIAGLYQFQYWAFEEGHLIIKILIDQFVYTPFIGIPIILITHQWKERDYSFSALRSLFHIQEFVRYALPMLIMNWCIWIPSLIVIYSMPLAIQAHISGLICGFWSLILLQIAARSRKAEAALAKTA